MTLGMGYPSGRARGMLDRDTGRTGIGRTDLGREAAERYARDRGAE